MFYLYMYIYIYIFSMKNTHYIAIPSMKAKVLICWHPCAMATHDLFMTFIHINTVLCYYVQPMRVVAETIFLCSWSDFIRIFPNLFDFFGLSHRFHQKFVRFVGNFPICDYKQSFFSNFFRFFLASLFLVAIKWFTWFDKVKKD